MRLAFIIALVLLVVAMVFLFALVTNRPKDLPMTSEKFEIMKNFILKHGQQLTGGQRKSILFEIKQTGFLGELETPAGYPIRMEFVPGSTEEVRIHYYGIDYVLQNSKQEGLSGFNMSAMGDPLGMSPADYEKEFFEKLLEFIQKAN